MVHLREEATGTVERDRFRAADQEAEQPIEAEEVVEMGMRDEDLVDLEDAPRGQRRDIAEVEEDCPPLEQGLDEDRGIAETAIDEHGMDQRPHCQMSGIGYQMTDDGQCGLPST